MSYIIKNLRTRRSPLQDSSPALGDLPFLIHRIVNRMKTLESDAEIHADGSVTLHPPIPSWLKPGRSRVPLVVNPDSENPSERVSHLSLEV